MTVTAIRTLVPGRASPSSLDAVASSAPVHAAPEFPFKGLTQAPLSEGQVNAPPLQDGAIILDNGSSTVKAGYSWNHDPTSILPPVVARCRDRKFNRTSTYVGFDAYADATTRGQIRCAFEPGTGIITNWDVMECILDFVLLRTGGKDLEKIEKPVVTTEALANLSYSRKMMNEIMFECYAVPSLAYGIDSLFSYRYHSGTSGLVVSSSHAASHIIPVLARTPLFHAATRLNWGGSQAQDYLLKLLRLKYPTFPGRFAFEQMEEYIKRYCRMSQDYDQELSHYLDWSGLEEQRDVIIQYPFTEHIVPEKSAEELARIAERKKESGRRLQEQAAKMRLEKLIKKEQELAEYKQLWSQYQDASSKKEQRRLLDANDFKDEASLERVMRELEKRIRKSRNKDLGGPEEEEEAVEEQVFPLLETPDADLNEQELKDKRHQRLLKSGLEARMRAKEEKERERARIAEENRIDIELRENNFGEWITGRREARVSLLAKMKERERFKQDAGNRKSVASQMRMKTLANLAADGPKRKRRGGGEHDDGFGANDDDWGVYRAVATEPASDEEEEEDPAATLRGIEAELLKYDPDFTEKETLEAQNDWTKSLVHAFLRGARPFDSESQREAHQIHLNVERIRVPEVIFQPSMAGVDQAGLVEIVGAAVAGRSDVAERQALLKDVFLTGGNTSFMGFEERLSRELRQVVDAGVTIKIRKAADPVLDSWRGAAKWWSSLGSSEKQAVAVSKDEYFEKGSEYIKEHSLGNAVAPPGAAMS